MNLKKFLMLLFVVTIVSSGCGKTSKSGSTPTGNGAANNGDGEILDDDDNVLPPGSAGGGGGGGTQNPNCDATYCTFTVTTSTGNWNSPVDPFVVESGKILRIVNNSGGTIGVHTPSNGSYGINNYRAICPHVNSKAAGATYTCNQPMPAHTPYDSSTSGWYQHGSSPLRYFFPRFN